jgi:hypothetical protein
VRQWRRQALETAMEAQSESARVSASKVLMDALAEPSDSSGGCRVCAQRKAEILTATSGSLRTRPLG